MELQKEFAAVQSRFAFIGKAIDSRVVRADLLRSLSTDQASALRLVTSEGLVVDVDGRLGWSTAVPAGYGVRLISLRDGPARELVHVPFDEACPMSIVAVPSDDAHVASHLRHWGGAASAASSVAAATVSCLFETAERCSQMRDGDEQIIHVSRDELGPDAIGPESLVPSTDRQRQSVNVPSTSAIDWVRARRHDGKQFWLPADYCLRKSRPSQSNWKWPAESSGSAAGISVDDATLRGLLEAVERDAVAIWWLNRVRRPPSPISGTDPLIAAVAAWQRAHQRRMHFLDLSSDLGIPVVGVVSFHDSGYGITLGFAADADPELAAVRAMREMLQFHAMVNLSLTLRPEPGGSDLDPNTAEARRWFLETRIEDEPYLLPDVDALTAPAVRAPTDQTGALAYCLSALDSCGLAPLVVELTRDWIGIPAVRVVVPGLRSLKRFLGPGRLYDVPVKMGWRHTPCSEEGLNPKDIPT